MSNDTFRPRRTFHTTPLGVVFRVVVALAAVASSPSFAARGSGRDATSEPNPTTGSSSSDSSSAIVRIVDFIAHPILEATTWPLEHIVAPGVEFITYPTQPPIRYFLEENVIDRATGLFQFGSGQDLSIYPTLSLASGTSSRTGVTLREGSPLGRQNDKLTAYLSYYVNGDYRLRTFYSSKSLWDSRWNGKVAFGLNRQEAATFYQPDVNLPYVYALNSESYETEFDYPILGDFRARFGFTFANNRFDEAPPALSNQASNTLTSDFFDTPSGFDATGASRGLRQDLFDRVWQVGLVRDTRTNENIPLDGSRLEALWYYHDVDQKHDFHEWRARYTTYFKLGAERYELTAREERALGGASVDRFVKQLEYQRLRQAIFSRKVLVFHMVAGQSHEVDGNRMPVYGLQGLGNSTPLRAYSGSRYRHYAVAATSAEYRFPMLRIMDGTIFNEYGVFGPSMSELDFGANLRNSWGFGVRVRRPDMFLFRIEMAFHGLSGAVLNATADTPF
jgi:hypothetical protein